MERMMPIDFDRAKLKKSFRGYDRSQVDDLLSRASHEIEVLLNEIKQAREVLGKQQADLETYRAQENLLKEALVLAQRTADETRFSAHKESDLILDEARRKADDIEKQAHQKLNDLRWDLERLRLDKQRFTNNFRALLEDHLRGLAEHGATLAVVEGAAEGVSEESPSQATAN
jgi:cell division initiation protein